jgi:UDP-N-acetylglucosamine 2-epimerase (non-hydrolysing)
VKVVTVLGTRPEIIRLSRVIERLDGLCEHVLVHTGQNFDERLSDVFFRELSVRAPDHALGVRGTGFGEQAGQILARVEAVLRDERPDRLLVLGDTNSGLSALVAKRMGVEVYHMEAGNRCYDDRVPEEVNRRVIDHSSDVLLPYTERSRANLLREGIAGDRILVTGNPIKEVIDHFAPRIAASDALQRLGLAEGRYFLVTLHRAENVDVEPRLRAFADALVRLSEEYALPVVCSLHPRTRDRLAAYGIRPSPEAIRFVEPQGFLDFVALEQRAFCVLSDSGTVQEECCLFGVPNVTLRDVTERPETLEVGSNMLSGADPAHVAAAVKTVLSASRRWHPPPEYLAADVSSTIAKILLGYRRRSAAA